MDGGTFSIGRSGFLLVPPCQTRVTSNVTIGHRRHAPGAANRARGHNWTVWSTDITSCSIFLKHNAAPCVDYGNVETLLTCQLSTHTPPELQTKTHVMLPNNQKTKLHTVIPLLQSQERENEITH